MQSALSVREGSQREEDALMKKAIARETETAARRKRGRWEKETPRTTAKHRAAAVKAKQVQRRGTDGDVLRVAGNSAEATQWGTGALRPGGDETQLPRIENEKSARSASCSRLHIRPGRAGGCKPNPSADEARSGGFFCRTCETLTRPPARLLWKIGASNSSARIRLLRGVEPGPEANLLVVIE